MLTHLALARRRRELDRRAHSRQRISDSSPTHTFMTDTASGHVYVTAVGFSVPPIARSALCVRAVCFRAIPRDMIGTEMASSSESRSYDLSRPLRLAQASGPRATLRDHRDGGARSSPTTIRNLNSQHQPGVYHDQCCTSLQLSADL